MKSDELYKKLKKLIYSAEFVIGDRLPTEQILANKYGVSRSTLRKAMQQLITEGLVDSHQGKGIFVKSKMKVDSQIFYREMDTPKFAIKILSFEMITAPLSVIAQNKR